MTRAGSTPYDAAFWQAALYRPETLLPADLGTARPADHATQPAPVKSYPGRPRFDLAAPALLLERTAHGADGLDGELLATLLHYSFGLVRHDLGPRSWPFHRAVASARCFYPTELYLCLPAGRQRPSGVYYFDPMHHQLVLLREQSGPATEAMAVLTSRFEKTGHRYGRYAPRLCAQEAGMVAGSVELVGRALGLRVSVDERTDAASALGPEQVDLAELLEPVGEQVMAVLRLADSDSGGTDTGAVELAQVLRSRNSGGWLFDPQPHPAPRAALDDIAQAVAATPLDSSCFVAVRAVAGLAQGIHRIDPASGALEPLREGPVVAALQHVGEIDGRVSMNYAAAGLVAYLAVPREQAELADGGDSFRRLHIAAGTAAHRISVAGARHGLATRIHNGYRAHRAEELLGLAGTGSTVVFQLAIGFAAPAPTFQLPVLF